MLMLHRRSVKIACFMYNSQGFQGTKLGNNFEPTYVLIVSQNKPSYVTCLKKMEQTTVYLLSYFNFSYTTFICLTTN